MVFWAHVLRFREAPAGPAPFALVHELKLGDRITMTTAAGKRLNYAVTYQHRVRPDEVEYLAPTPLEQITLISCIGTRVMVRGELTLAERLVTIGEPIQ
jgi:sortase (surface protein transpeptidase)